LTLREQIVLGLERMGYPRVPELQKRSPRYAVFKDKNYPGCFIYVGKRGGVRSGPVNYGSVALDGIRAIALAAGAPTSSGGDTSDEIR
jgi:hypothetical protein